MARKSVTKSKPVTKIRKYQTGSMYQQVTNPYYISGSYREEAKLEAERAMKEAARFGDYSQSRAIDLDVRRKEQEAEEKKAKEELLLQTAEQKRQEERAFGQEVVSTAGNEALSYTKKMLAERAAKKTAEKTATDALATAGNTAAAVVTPTANTVAQGIAPTITAQAARGSGMEAARVFGSNLIDDTGAVVLPQAGTSAASTGAGAGAVAAGSGAAAAGANTGLLAANMSGLASAGIGLGLTGAGYLVQRKMDTDPTKYSKKEGRQNAWGDALKGAGTGFGAGVAAGTIIPGVGNVVGGIVGGLAGFGIGLAKGIGENKRMQADAGKYAEEEARIKKLRDDEEARRQAEVARQTQLMASAANRGFVGSRLQGLNTGFGYNTSTNMNTQPTSSFYGKTGGSLPGGHVVPIGDDAVKFIGRKHSEGGIKLDPQTEVEGGETMDKVMMNGGKPNDYFFSSYLKLGGKSFAKRHEELIKSGASQAAIQDLAKKQEAVANKKGEKDRGPEQIAAYGGIHKYQTAGQKLVAGPTGKPVYKPFETLTDEERYAYNMSEGDSQLAVAPNLPWVKDKGEVTSYGNPQATYDFGTKPAAANNSRRPGPDSTAAEQVDSKGARTPQQSADAQSNRSAKTGTTVRDQNKANTNAPKDQTSVAPGGTTNNAGQSSANAAKKATNANTTGTGSGANKTSTTNTPTSTRATPSSSRTGAAGAVDLGNQIFEFIGLPKGKSALSADDEGGTSMSIKGVPAGQKTGKKFFGNVTDMEFAAMKTANPWYDFSNFDPSNKAQVLNFQQEYNKRVKSGEKLKEDGKFGQQTASSRLYKDAPAAADKGAEEKIETVDPGTMGPPTPGEDYFKKAEEEKIIAKTRKGVNGSLLAGLGQLIPVGYALARPYKTEGNLPRMQSAGNVGAGSVRGAILPRVNMNAERAAAIAGTVATKNAIQNTNAGPGGIAAMMAANAAQNTQMLAIANQEQEANKQLAAEEARMGQQASQFNVQTGLEAGKVNVANRLSVNQSNLEAGIQEARMKIDEKRYKREEILGALDTAASRIAGIVKDEKSYKAQERLAKAIDNTGSYDRFTILEQLQKESKNKNSPYYGKTDIELKKIASDTYNEVIGKMGLEGDQTARTGGRKYTSRLGQLSRGKKTFNI
jgi:hypothetical protein